MPDTTKPRRPIGRDGDLVQRRELDARMDGANQRLATVAAQLHRLGERTDRDTADAARVWSETADQIREMGNTLDERIRDLEARTFAGRIARLRAWWDRVTAALEARFVEVVLVIDNSTDDEQGVVAAPVAPVASEPVAIAEAVAEPPIEQSGHPLLLIRWTGEPSCLPENLRRGFHEGSIERIDKAIPIRNTHQPADADELLCYVGDDITVDVDGNLGVLHNCRKCGEPFQASGETFAPGQALPHPTSCDGPFHPGLVGRVVDAADGAVPVSS